MNKYAIIFYTSYLGNEEIIQKILLKYNKINPYTNIKEVIFTLEGISVISSKGPTIIEFVGDKFILTNKSVFLRKKYDLEVNEDDILFEAIDDDSAKLVFETI